MFDAMCMLVVARRVHPRYPLVLVANRDEVHARPAEPLHEWTADTEGISGIVAGRDVTAGGTWLSLASGAGLAAVTNVREGGPERPAAASRGELPVDALTGPVPVTGFAQHVVDDLGRYGPVNLLAGDLDEMWWASNRSGRGPMRLGTGVHGLSNAAPDTPWPKVVGAVAQVRTLLGTEAISGQDWSGPLLDLLADRRKAPIRHLPRTGVPLWHEWRLSSRFVRIGRWYGTRSTTAVRIDEHGTADVVERTWDARGRVAGTVTARL
ncbi:NRDE family protein [Dietzia sp. Cai40]|uniref:NRDE family protein n=2 Tax=unclassified Dietzia TaxID=2617939 RepID=UPI0032206061